MRQRTRYTQRILQFEADRWSLKLKQLGHQLPDTRITVYTSGVDMELAIGHTIEYEEPALGIADYRVDGTPAVLVRLPRGRYAERDPLEVLIHELLHHAKPALTHEEMYRLTPQLRLEDSDALLPFYPLVDGTPVDDSEVNWSGLASISEDQGTDLLHDLYLEANGFIKKPPRSLLTGRFV